jgi:hypothetical protein
MMMCGLSMHALLGVCALLIVYGAVLQDADAEYVEDFSDDGLSDLEDMGAEEDDAIDGGAGASDDDGSDGEGAEGPKQQGRKAPPPPSARPPRAGAAGPTRPARPAPPPPPPPRKRRARGDPRIEVEYEQERETAADAARESSRW